MAEIHRRTFLAGAATTAALAAVHRSPAADANNSVVLAIMGVNGRGSQLAQGFAQQPGVEIAYVCDCDERAIAKGIAAATSHGAPPPKGIKDFRQALDDPAVDALVCAAPNHWHAAATILACAAGKHVYVEKPASHTVDEGERMVAAARSANRVVQVGTQRRSAPHYRRLIERVRAGEIGPVLYAKSTYYNDRPSIGRGKEVAPPAWLDYNLWQGPAPEQPYRDNLIHYNWHFFWHWGNGELGNNGVHTIDVCRWAAGVDFPSKVTVAGAKLRYEDDQQTPDTLTATFACGGRTIVWEGISWSPTSHSGNQVGMELRGELGTVFLDDDGYTVYDLQGKVIAREEKGNYGEAEHLRDFLDAVRNGSRPHADIEDGHKSAAFCHLGNIAYRTGQPLEIDPASGHIVNNLAAEALRRREYRPGWLPAT